MSTERPLFGKRAPAGPWDVLVVGSGMGGLTAAAFLSKLGRRVLLLEQHYVPGGFTHTFRRKHWTFDVGVHAVGEVTRHSMTGRLLAKLTDGRLKWTSLGPVYDTFRYPDGFRIDFPDTPQKFRENLVAAFPAEHAAIDRYLDDVRDVASAMKGYYLARSVPRFLGPVADRVLGARAQAHLGRRTRDVLDARTKDERLKAVLVAQWGYYGSTPSRSSFAMQALVTRHFLHGGYYPEGGSKAIATELMTTVADAGGYTRIRADVASILVEGGRAVGVRLTDGEELRAKKVISAAGVRATVERMVPAPWKDEPWARSIAALTPAAAHVCLYVGFRGDIRAGGASSANHWFYETWDTEADAWQVDPALPEQPRAPVLYTSFPSLKDPHHDAGPEQLHTGEIVTFVPWRVFERWRSSEWQHRGEEYERFKRQLADRLLEQLLEHMPGLRAHVAFTELSTPLSTDHFVRPIAGSIYGLEPTPERFENPALRPHSPIPGLYFAGSEVSTVGVIGAMMGGVLATLAAEPARALRYLTKV